MDDAPRLQSLFPRWENVRYLNGVLPWPYPADGAQSFLQMHIAAVEAGALRAWMICLKEDDQSFLGCIELRPFDGATRDMRGFWLAAEFQGRGYMTEAADRVTDFAFRNLGWPELWFANAAPNTRSIAVKQRQGAELIETIEGRFVEGVLPKQIWRLERSEWLARHP
jgi:RimJ/RimL family protein N-acetyltransferase